MAELPSGTVTFLFTDIEGSTRLLTRLRGKYAEVLAEHQRLLRAAFNEYDGREVHTEGDAFFVAFARARDAVAAAIAGQRALASERWPEGVAVRVRMGVHTGEAAVSVDDYVGLDVHRAARICSAGHGGQVLISSSTRELVADELPQDVALKDLGEHRLKDLDRPEHLFQVVAGDLPGDFPPLASLSPGSDGPNGLPPSPNRTIGRGDDVRAIADRLRVDGVRLLTLTGPGGVGKTRLAAGGRARSRGGLRRRRAFRLARRAAQARGRARGDRQGARDRRALGRVCRPGRRTLPGRQAPAAGRRQLRAAAGGRAVHRRAAEACPALTVLATSREPLGLHAEERYPVSPLALPARATPEDPDALAGVDAVALFCARARAHDPDFDLDDANARRGRGDLPARRRAAAGDRAGGRALRAAVARRDRRAPATTALGALGAGARDAPARQQTLRATIDWSHELLSDAEKQCFARFAVFAGGATVEAAETITPPDSTRSTAWSPRACSRAARHALAPTRLGMLETIRAYAAERFASTADDEAVREGHYRYYLALAQRHGTERALVGRGRARSTSPGWTPRSTTSTRLSGGRSAAERRTGARDGAALGCYWVMRNRYADAAGLGRAGPEPAGRRRPSGPARPRSLHEGHVPVADGARSRATRGRGRGGGHRPTAWRSRDPLPSAPSCASITRLDAERLDVADAARRRGASTGPELPATSGRSPKRPAQRRWRRPASPICASASTGPPRCSVTSATSINSRTCSPPRPTPRSVSAGDRDAADFAARATPIARALDNPFLWMINSGNLGLAALLTGETDTASHAFREELALCREMVVRPVAFEGLRGLAAVAVVARRRPRAPRHSSAPLTHTATTSPRIRSRPGSKRPSSSPPAHGAGPTHGTPPRAKAAR